MTDPSARASLPGLVALDLDGTLLTSDKRITKRTRAAVRALADRGAHVVLCTGRPPRSTVAYAAELGLDHPFVCYNGAAFFDPATETLTVRHRLEPQVVLRAVERLRRAFPGVAAGLETESGWYLEPEVAVRRRGEARLGPEEPTAIGPIETFVDAGAIKLLLSHPTADAEALASAVEGLPVYRTWSTPALLELMAPEVDKRSALEELCSELGLEPRDVAAFGDQRNDIEMIAWAGLGVAVANASEAVRAAATVVAASNDAEGVAGVVEGWLAGSPHHLPTGES